MKKSIEEINEKIKSGRSVVLTAEEVSKMSEDHSPGEIAKKVDVVTTATFGPMCSSGAFINFGHSDPPIRMENIWLNDVPVFPGVAAVDAYIGATSVSEKNEKYGGAHILEALVKGEDIRLKATAKGTDCYPRKSIDSIVNKDSVNEIIMINPRNAYQNYPAAINTSSKLIYTYMGNLLPKMGNITYSTSGELSPLLNDPEMRTIGIGTRIFLCGAQGYVAWNGTQFHTTKPKNKDGIPKENAASLALIGDMKAMNEEFIKAAYYEKYGVSIFIGVGIPIPMIDEEMAHFVSIKNKDIQTFILDYGTPGHPSVGETNYRELMSGEILINNKKIRTAPLSSIFKARTIAERLKQSISKGDFFLSRPVQNFPKNTSLSNLKAEEE